MKKVKKQQQKKSSSQSINANFLYEEFAKYFTAGSASLAQGKLNEAEKSYRAAIALRPDFAETHNNLGIVLQEQGKINSAIECHQRALVIKPNFPEAYQNLGVAFKVQKKLDRAIENYQKALALKPDYIAALDDLFHTRLKCCDWTEYVNSKEKICKIVNENKPGPAPLEFFSVSTSLAEQLKCTLTFAADNSLLPRIPVWTGQRYQHDKIRIAYISGDFREHAVSFLTAGLFGQHDKQRFEIIAISLKPEDKSLIGQRVKKAFNEFIDVSGRGNYEVALLIQELEIDIAVDLMGLTANSRTAIFAYRPAPVQINYLGFPGTMGAEYIDYIIADKLIIPPEQQVFYTEKVVYLPDSYLVNDSKRMIAEYTPTRAEVNLPEAGFIFCCFNNSYKITPDIFTIWMRLLSKVENSVLWLSESNSFMADNLRKEAILRGIAPERLIFAPKLKKIEEHLARQKVADLFLDTLPYNAHSTASDALWAGLPVLTCLGNTFAGRVASSLLNAIGLPELIAANLEEYESLAFQLATTPALLSEIRAKLARNRDTYPLFNTDRFCRHIESTYIEMWQRSQRGELPASFAVQPID